MQSRILKRAAIGVDLNPLALAITRAKIADVALSDLHARIDDLSRDFRPGDEVSGISEGLRIIYHPRTLGQMAYLRSALVGGRPEDDFLRGALLGIMHGKQRADGSSAYLSIDMPNTFSMSPEYVRGFVERNDLRQRPADVFRALRDRVTWLLRDGLPKTQRPLLAFEGDATQLGELFKVNSLRRASALVTSPPYLGILRYGAFNWIRLWFLGHDPTAIDRRLDGTDSMDRYLAFMTSFLTSASEVLEPRSPVALVIGDVVEQGQHVRLAERVWEELEGVVPYDLLSIGTDAFDEGSKTTRIWGQERKGRATPVDRVLTLVRHR
jgi:hypothetical protein